MEENKVKATIAKRRSDNLYYGSNNVDITNILFAKRFLNKDKAKLNMRKYDLDPEDYDFIEIESDVIEGVEFDDDDD